MRIVVAMSGGVDSSVAAALLAEQGHEVIGLSMQLYDASSGSFGSCCTPADLNDARRVALASGFPHYILNFERQFQETSSSRPCSIGHAGWAPSMSPPAITPASPRRRTAAGCCGEAPMPQRISPTSCSR